MKNNQHRQIVKIHISLFLVSWLTKIFSTLIILCILFLHITMIYSMFDEVSRIIKSFAKLITFVFFRPSWTVSIITELRENEMSVVVLERKSIAAIKTGAPRLYETPSFYPDRTGSQFFPSAFACDGHGEHWISLEIFKYGRCAHILGKKLTEKTHFGQFTLVIGYLESIRRHRM